MKLGIDIGSTTVKLVVIDDENKIIYKRYERHMSNVMEKVTELLEDLYKTHKRADVQAVITGSGGLALSELMGVYFEQEIWVAAIGAQLNLCGNFNSANGCCN